MALDGNSGPLSSSRLLEYWRVHRMHYSCEVSGMPMRSLEGKLLDAFEDGLCRFLIGPDWGFVVRRQVFCLL